MVYVWSDCVVESYLLWGYAPSGSQKVSFFFFCIHLFVLTDDRTLDLIDRLCICFAQCSTDEEYPAVRYGKQLEALRNKLAGLSDVKTTHSPSGGGDSGSQTVRLPRTQQNRAREVRVSPSQTAASPNTLPLPQQFDPRPLASQPARYHVIPSEHAMNSPAWQLPVMQQYTQPVMFPYPTTPVPIPAGPSAEMPAPYVAPPHQQPFMEFGVAQSSDGLNLGMNDHTNLGFTSLDDWFGFGAAGTGGGAGQDGNGVDDPMGLANVGLDLQDFWMNVGPGEVSVGSLICRKRFADSFLIKGSRRVPVPVKQSAFPAALYLLL